ncbi:START domain-containing protein [uncultured Psychroserpens sp.]|uniref:START domain-containing protein n=1 Tax=uncultured Psychroserpens sp. TaxID=255436 RepID=UPI00260FCF0E|nr:START domain-containing protein [uncultured Psychroserpens sp.]
MKKSIIAFLFCLPTLMFSQNEWTLKKDDDNIKIYTRDAANSNIKEFKAVTTIDTGSKHILDELLTAPDYYENCEPNTSYYVKKLNENQHVFYAHKDLPWPIKDRDIITLLTVNKINSKTIKLTLESLPEELPKKDKTIRVKKLMGHWLLEEVEGKTKVTQQLFLNPEGSLPSFVVNSLLIKGPYKTFKDLHKTTTHSK